MEQWKEIIGYSNYEISNTGKVKNKIRGNLLVGGKDTRGYTNITLKKGKTERLHRLVAIHFIDNPNNLPEVNHIDGDKTNNNDWNLEWSTTQNNQLHSYRILKRKTTKGYKYPNRKSPCKQLM